MAKPGRKPGTPKTGGRKAGTPNKIPSLLKDAIIEAATLAGDKDGLVGYLQTQATANPGPFLALLGKVLPLQIAGDPESPILVTRVERVIIDAVASEEREVLTVVH